MAVRFDNSADTLSRTTNLPTITSFTMMGWFYLTNSRTSGATETMLAFGDTLGVKFYQFYDNNNLTFTLWNGLTDTVGSTFTAATWYHLAMTCAGTGAGQFLGYLNGVLNITAPGDTGPTASKIFIGNDSASEWWDGRFAAIKIYSAVLTAAEIANEMRQYIPIRTVNLNGFYPMSGATVTDFTTDYSGSANALTAAGTLTREDGPPIPWRQGRRKTIKKATSAIFIAPRSTIINQSVNRASNY